MSYLYDKLLLSTTTGSAFMHSYLESFVASSPVEIKLSTIGVKSILDLVNVLDLCAEHDPAVYSFISSTDPRFT